MKLPDMKGLSDPEQVRAMVLSIQESMDDIRPTNIELMEAIAFVLGETLAYGVGVHGMDETAIDGAIMMMGQLTKASAQVHSGKDPDLIGKAN